MNVPRRRRGPNRTSPKSHRKPNIARLKIKTATLKALFLASGNRCAFPSCKRALRNQRGKLVIEICHIEAANEDGPRFNSEQSDEERRHYDNLILLCPTHHEETHDEGAYSADDLREMKRDHESRIAAHTSALDDDEADFLAQRDLTRHQQRLRSIAISKLPKTGGGTLVGRGKELVWLEEAWGDESTHVVSIVAWGGVGKTRLVKEWTGRLAAENWPGVERYFDWSFYSQGTKDHSAATAEFFVADALEHFGDPDPKAGSAHDRGKRLALLVAERPTLLVLDGLEPMQYGPGPLQGELKDPALKALLKGLAQRPFPGLCVITTREKVKDLESLHGKTVDERVLEHLSEEAGAHLLHDSGARRAGAAQIEPDDNELKEASTEVKGHALTLRLLSRYLALAHDGDIRQRALVRLETANTEVQGGHSFRVMEAYERWFEQTEKGEQQLAALRLLGLFDRPADLGIVEALRQEPVIEGLTEPLMGLSDAQWKIALKRIGELDLLTYIPGAPLDAHPLVREYFADQLRPTPAWQAAHQRIYEYLTTTTEHQPDDLPGLQPLYQAIAHGCQAGLHRQACEGVYRDRILRGTGSDGFYSWKQLGAFGANLGVQACFFEEPWKRLSPNLSPVNQAWMLNETAISLRALGRLAEALEAMRTGLEMRIEQQAQEETARIASNLSELELTLGNVEDAITDGAQAMALAAGNGNSFLRVSFRTTYADALHQAGQRKKTLHLFQEAEDLQTEWQEDYPRLYSLRGFRYCDVLLADAERAALRLFLAVRISPEATVDRSLRKFAPRGALVATCNQVAERASETLVWVQPQEWLLDIALDHLTLGRSALYRGILTEGDAPKWIQPASTSKRL